MQCAQCNRELPAGATHCPYCGADLGKLSAAPAIAGSAGPQQATADRQTFCVKCGAPLPPQAGFCTQCSTPRPGTGFQPAPNPPVGPVPVPGQLVCPRCHSTNVLKGKIAQWAILVAVIGALFTCLLSLLFLLVKDPNKCLNCGYEFK
jgi:ribosomal protein L40E